jgi:hypothetical protein
VGVNAAAYDSQLYADAGKSGRVGWGDPVDYFGKPKVASDANGWPTADAGHLFWSGADPTKTGGTYLLQFTGQAQVSGMIGRGHFSAGGTDYGAMLPAGAGYDPVTNTTTATVAVDGTDLFGLNFTHTRRLPHDAEGTGVTNVQFMRPTIVGGTTSYQPGDLFAGDVKQAFSRFTTIRYLTANFNAEKQWADRKLPGAMQATYGDRAALWENEVMLANETGKDLYITLPVGASEDYVRNLALLIRNGSDGVMPYAEPVADPVYPGLNPNLRVYVEWGNEIWNWAFSQGGWAADAGRAAVLANTAEGQIVNFDSQRPNGDFRRWAALKTVEASNDFRSVWGDAAMGNQVRVLFEYQYNNQQSTASESLKFIDRYFNNSDGFTYVADPHPVNYFIWGAGGAAYYGAANPRGLVSDITVPAGNFESIVGGPGGTATPDPTGTPWTFDGDAGIYRNLAGLSPNAAMPIADVGKLPATPGGKQAMYVSGKGSASVTINFRRAGVFAVDFQAAAELGADMGDTLDFFIGDQRVTPDNASLTPAPYPWWPGNGHRDAGSFSTYGTVPIQITTPGLYTFRIVGRGTPERTTVIDDIRVSSLDAIYKSRIPTGVRAAGEVRNAVYQSELAIEAGYAQAYGLNVVAYEGGWSLGGDSTAVPIETWAKYRDARTAPVMSGAVATFFQAGGSLLVLGTFDQWSVDDAAHADTYPLVKGIDTALRVLPPLPTGGLVVRKTGPVTLYASSGMQLLTTPGLASPGDWVSWTVRVLTTGDYKVTARAEADGWASVHADGNEVGRGSSGLAPGGVVHLTAGVHTIRVESIGGRFAIQGVTLNWVAPPSV